MNAEQIEQAMYAKKIALQELEKDIRQAKAYLESVSDVLERMKEAKQHAKSMSLEEWYAHHVVADGMAQAAVETVEELYEALGSNEDCDGDCETCNIQGEVDLIEFRFQVAPNSGHEKVLDQITEVFESTDGQDKANSILSRLATQIKTWTRRN